MYVEVKLILYQPIHNFPCFNYKYENLRNPSIPNFPLFLFFPLSFPFITPFSPLFSTFLPSLFPLFPSFLPLYTSLLTLLTNTSPFSQSCNIFQAILILFNQVITAYLNRPESLPEKVVDCQACNQTAPISAYGTA